MQMSGLYPREVDLKELGQVLDNSVISKFSRGILCAARI